MPDLRVVTWNSSGESNNQGQQLVNDVADINNFYAHPVRPVQLVVIQEASVVPSTIANALINSPPFAAQFVQPPGFSREHTVGGQPFRITPSRAYRLSHMVNGPAPGLNLASAALNPVLVNLSTTNDAGVLAYINGLGHMTLWDRHCLLNAAGSIRWPIYQHFAYAGQNVHFFSWHAPLRRNWLNADVLNVAFQGPALPIAFEFLQHSQFFTNIRLNLAANDLLLIAGDLNITHTDLALPGMFNHFVSVSDNLTHIIAYCPTGVAVNQNHSYVTPFPPHTILTARVQW